MSTFVPPRQPYTASEVHPDVDQELMAGVHETIAEFQGLFSGGAQYGAMRESGMPGELRKVCSEFFRQKWELGLTEELSVQQRNSAQGVQNCAVWCGCTRSGLPVEFEVYPPALVCVGGEGDTQVSQKEYQVVLKLNRSGVPEYTGSVAEFVAQGTAVFVISLRYGKRIFSCSWMNSSHGRSLAVIPDRKSRMAQRAR